MPTLRKIKRGVLPTHLPTRKTPHLILPNRTQSPPTNRLQDEFEICSKKGDFIL